jgi:acyl carrier protein
MGEQVEAEVTKLFMTARGLAEDGDLDRTYFAVDGDSLTAVHLIGELRDKFGIEVPVTIFLQELTVRDIIAAALAPPDEALLESLLDDIDN